MGMHSLVLDIPFIFAFDNETGINIGMNPEFFSLCQNCEIHFFFLLFRGNKMTSSIKQV